MITLSKEGARSLELAETRYALAIQEADLIRSVRIAGILEDHGLPGETQGRFSRSGPKDFVFIPDGEDPPAEPVKEE